MTFEEYYQEAENHYLKGHYNEALRGFEEALKLEESKKCLNYIGCCYLKLNKMIPAIRTFEKLIKDNPHWERPLFNLARTYMQLGKFKKAFSYLNQAYFINPANEDVNFYLGVYYYKQRKYEDSKIYYEKSLALNNDSYETHQNLGMCYAKLRDYQRAIEEFDIAYGLNNDLKVVLYNKGIAYICLRQYQKAVDSFLQYYESDPDNLDNICFDIAYCYFRLQELEKAQNWLQKLIATNPEHEDGISLLDHIDNQLKRNKEDYFSAVSLANGSPVI